jgi:hypothetical protein
MSPPAAIAAGRFRFAGASGNVAVGFPAGQPGAGNPSAGEVFVVQGSTINRIASVAQEPDRFGSALAIGDFDGSGAGSIAVGAPGTSGGNGAIYVLVDGQPQPVTPQHTGQNGEQLGSALATGDVDGDGDVDIVAGAPYGKNVYVFRTGKSTIMLHEDGVSGFGAAVAASSDGVLVGAPESNRVRLYQMNAGNLTLAFEWTAPAGGFGAAVALADVDGDGRADLVAAAPAEGSGVVYVLRASDRTGTAASVTTAHSAALRAALPLAQMGTGLAVLRGQPWSRARTWPSTIPRRRLQRV